MITTQGRLIGLLVVFSLLLLIGIFSWVTPMSAGVDALIVVGLAVMAFMVTLDEREVSR